MQDKPATFSDDLHQIYMMQNPIQNYAWGSRSAIAELMGFKKKSKQPQAEIWMGAHPKAPSKIWYGGNWRRLDHMIANHPESLLGSEVMQRFNGRLPYLFKILAVSRPLSIQAHPNADQAKTGFENENRLQIPMTAEHRNYKDDRHKPECISALTPFWGLCGFRAMDRMLQLLDSVWPSNESDALNALRKKSLEEFFTHIMTMPSHDRVQLIARATGKAKVISDQDPAYHWMLRLHMHYPGDIGVLSPLLLNLVHLKPGQAIFLKAGQLHAYLDGMGVELMANSDNVLRGGLTPKHVDVMELLSILDFAPCRLEILERQALGNAEIAFPSPVEDFRLSVIDLQANRPYVFGDRIPAPEILLCTRTESSIECKTNRQVVAMRPGRSIFIPAGVEHYALQGSGTVHKAAMNM
jgi:mannose-6-phosphate isomerase